MVEFVYRIDYSNGKVHEIGDMDYESGTEVVIAEDEVGALVAFRKECWIFRMSPEDIEYKIEKVGVSLKTWETFGR